MSAPGCDGEVAAGVPSAPADVAGASAGTDGLTLTWDAPAVTGDGPVTGYVVSRSGSATTQTLGADARSHTFTGLAAGTTYQLSVRAVNATRRRSVGHGQRHDGGADAGRAGRSA